MPVRKVKGGYKWGHHGHVYKSRAGAEKQARAIYAAGWREDALNNRNARRTRAAGMMLAVKVAEDKYVRDLRSVMRALHSVVMDELSLRQDAKRTRANPLVKSFDAIARLREPTEKVFDAMSIAVAEKTFEISKTLLGVTPANTGLREAMAAAREANVALIIGAGEDYLSQVEGVLKDPDNFGLRVEDLRDKILERSDVSESRAELIARDQTLKLNASINEIRQTNAGVLEYTWSTSNDERVRPTHAVMDGRTCSWSSPPMVGDEQLNPGEDFQCRCIALPVIPGDED